MTGRTELKRKAATQLMIFVFVITGVGIGLQGSGSAADTTKAVGGKLIYSSLKAIHTYEPITSNNLASTMISSLMFESLVDRDPFQIGVIPKLADRFESSQNDIVFYLKANITWHDGEPFTADDVVFTFKLIMNPETKSALGQSYDFVRSITKVNETTVRFSFKFPVYKPELRFTALKILPSHVFSHLDPIIKEKPINKTLERKVLYASLSLLKEPSANAIKVYDLPIGCIVTAVEEENEWVKVIVQSKGVKGKEGWMPKYRTILTPKDAFVTNPVGSGYYKFKTVDFKGDVYLERNANHHGDSAYISFITRHMLTDKQTLINDINLGNIDLIPETPLDQVPALSPLSVKKVDYPSLSFSGFVFNCKRPPLNNAQVRFAMSQGFDRESQFRYYYTSKGSLLAGPFSHDSYGINLDLAPLPFDEAKSRVAIAQQAPNSKGLKPLVLAVKNDENSLVFDVCYSFINAMNKIGIPVELRKLDRRKWQADLENGEFDLAYVEWAFDIGYNIYSIFHSTGKLNYGGYANAEVDNYLDQLRKTTDSDVLIELAGKTQEILYKDCPYMFLWTLDNIAAVNFRVMGVEPHTISPFGFFDYVNKWWIPIQNQ